MDERYGTSVNSYCSKEKQSNVWKLLQMKKRIRTNTGDWEGAL